MKTKAAVLLITLVLTSLVCNAQKINVEGTWKIIGSGGQAIPENFSQIKLITPTHFMWVITDNEGNIFNGAGGTYTLDNDVYTENITKGLPGMKNFLGKKATYKVKITGKKMTITGKLEDIEVNEVWEKID